MLATAYIRFFIALTIRFQAMSKKEFREYKKAVKGLKKWFFIDAAAFCKDKYSKSEHRKIKHSLHVDIYMVLNVVNHIVLLIHGLVIVLYWKNYLSEEIAKLFILINLFMILFAFAVLAIVENNVNRNLHRRLEHRR